MMYRCWHGDKTTICVTFRHSSTEVERLHYPLGSGNQAIRVKERVNIEDDGASYVFIANGTRGVIVDFDIAQAQKELKDLIKRLRHAGDFSEAESIFSEILTVIGKQRVLNTVERWCE